MKVINRVIVIILDSVGIGELPDAADYGDVGCNTLANTALAVGGLNLPNLKGMGLGNIAPIKGVEPVAIPSGAYGKMAEISRGKDTTTGHWELAGVILEKPFPVFPQGFPEEFIQAYQQRIGREVLGNKVASGTFIIEELGPEHLAAGKPIVYTSADSVFQIAAHEDVVPIEELYHYCQIAREMLQGKLGVGRVIARPFIGKPGSFQRTTNRHDFSLPPVKQTILEVLEQNQMDVLAVGKIVDIFANKGVTNFVRTKSNQDGIDKTIKYIKTNTRGMIFTNLVEYDQNYGHRNDSQGYARALAEFDVRLPEIFAALKDDDILVITADHGCDPTTTGTDHSREYIPILVGGKMITSGINLGIRQSFSDLAATIGEIFQLNFPVGNSFAKEIFKGVE